ncbi:MAG: type IV pili methyl-accepting chemotaxis transducer N-terminal domain-containing protein [Pseudomonadota bacterium]
MKTATIECRGAARAVAAMILAAGSVYATPSIAFETEETVKAKINLAGRQRMLSQRMAKTACMVFNQADRAAQEEALKKAYTLFTRTHFALRFGDPELRLMPEKSSAVLRFLEAVQKEWAPYNAAMKPVTKGKEIKQTQLVTIAQTNIPVLATMNKAVGRMERTYGAKAGIRDDARAINYAGAQRMLSQRMAKEYCLIAAGIAPDENRFALAQSIALFDKRQRMLMNGDANAKVPVPSDPTVVEALAASMKAWQSLQEMLSAVAGGVAPTDASLEAVSSQADLLLKRAHAAVQAMEHAS